MIGPLLLTTVPEFRYRRVPGTRAHRFPPLPFLRTSLHRRPTDDRKSVRTANPRQHRRRPSSAARNASDPDRVGAGENSSVYESIFRHFIVRSRLTRFQRMKTRRYVTVNFGQNVYATQLRVNNNRCVRQVY